MPIKVGLKHIEIWNASMEKAVCKYEEEPIHKGELCFTVHPILRGGVNNFVKDHYEK